MSYETTQKITRTEMEKVDKVDTAAFGILLQRFIEWDRRKSELQQCLSVIEKDIADMKEQLIDAFIELGVSSVKIDGRTVYLKTQLWAYDKGQTPRLRDTLNMMGYSAVLTAPPKVNTHKLSAIVREVLRARGMEGAVVPEELDGLVTVEEKVDVGITGR